MAAVAAAPAAMDGNTPDTPGPIVQRVQSPFGQALQIREPAWIPRDADRQAEALMQQRSTTAELLTHTAIPAEPRGLAKRRWTARPH